LDWVGLEGPPWWERHVMPQVFIISIISANDRIKRVEHVDIGQTLVNLGHHLENLVNNH
jgi:hypothetical protein